MEPFRGENFHKFRGLRSTQERFLCTCSTYLQVGRCCMHREISLKCILFKCAHPHIPILLCTNFACHLVAKAIFSSSNSVPPSTSNYFFLSVSLIGYILHVSSVNICGVGPLWFSALIYSPCLFWTVSGVHTCNIT